MSFVNNPQIASTQGGFAPILLHGLLEANSQSFTTGEIVYSNSGAITVISGTPFTAATVMGIAQAAGTNVTSGNTEIQVKMFFPWDVWRIKLINNGTAAYASSFSVGTAYGLYVASNVHYLDVNTTNQDMAVFLGADLKPGDASDGSDCEWGLIRWLPTMCQAITGR